MTTDAMTTSPHMPMSAARLAEVLQYPSVWVASGLLCEELVALQAPQVLREYGTSAPDGGTEHWRYYAFDFWLHRPLNSAQLESLLEAAIADPDPPMAGNVFKAIAAHPLCTPELLQAAQSCVARTRDYYVKPAELDRLYRSRPAEA